MRANLKWHSSQDNLPHDGFWAALAALVTNPEQSGPTSPRPAAMPRLTAAERELHDELELNSLEWWI